MPRLWDKGQPIDRLVLEYTAGEDHRLDERLVPHDVRATIAHAEMLHAQGHLAADQLAAIRGGLDDYGRYLEPDYLPAELRGAQPTVREAITAARQRAGAGGADP